MKQFDIEKAKAGHPVCTRDGRKARIIFWEAKGDMPIVALITCCDEGEESVSYRINGMLNYIGDNPLDLMLAPTKHEGWVNVFRGKTGCYVDRDIWDFEENAKAIGKEFAEYIASVKVEWEE